MTDHGGSPACLRGPFEARASSGQGERRQGGASPARARARGSHGAAMGEVLDRGVALVCASLLRCCRARVRRAGTLACVGHARSCRRGRAPAPLCSLLLAAAKATPLSCKMLLSCSLPCRRPPPRRPRRRTTGCRCRTDHACDDDDGHGHKEVSFATAGGPATCLDGQHFAHPLRHCLSWPSSTTKMRRGGAFFSRKRAFARASLSGIMKFYNLQC
jgi:hypothetical protein